MSGAVVTGAGRGLGLEIARRLAGRGLAVNVTDVDAAAAANAAEEIGAGAWSTALDVRTPDACRAAARETAERAGSLDVWVNNAGILVTGFVWDHDEETRRRSSRSTRSGPSTAPTRRSSRCARPIAGT